MSEIAYIKLANLYLWTDNPRVGTVENEIDEILKLIEAQQQKNGNKLIALAKSIVAYGIIEPIGVLKHSDGFLVVKEGNRRITCLKLMKNPLLIPEEYAKLRNAFMKIKTEVKSEIYNKIPARVFGEDENDKLEEWIELRHNGLQDGKGLDTWGAREKDNWRKHRGENTPLLNFQNYLVNQGILDQEQIFSVNKTNWERILGSIGREYLGVELKNGQYFISIEKDDFIRRISKTVESLKGKSVSAVYDNDKKKEFFESLKLDQPEVEEEIKETVDEVEGYEVETKEKFRKTAASEQTKDTSKNEDNKTSSASIEVDNQQNNRDEEKESNKDNDADSDDPGRRRSNLKTAPLLSNLICDLESNNDTDGIIRLVAELKKVSRNKDYVQYPIATAMLMRSLLEQSLIYYLKKRSKWTKFHRSKSDPTLTDIINKFNNDPDIFTQDKKLERYFIPLLSTPGLKEFFNMITHHINIFSATPVALESIAQSGYAALVQHIIDFDSEKAGQE
ncbi:MAG: hypothetical protein ACOZCL_08670 [Bacillota bacterium]